MRDETRQHCRTHPHHGRERAYHEQGHREHHSHVHEGGPMGHEHHGPGGEGGHRRGGGHFGGPRDRARRGEARYVLLDALRDGPKHGYEIIKSLEEKSGGQYAPSPGTVYPTMQFLEDQGLVRADQESERRVYHLTDAGRAALETHAEELAAFWARFSASAMPGDEGPEIGFLQEEIDTLNRTIGIGLRNLREQADQETIRRIRQAIEHCRGEIRAIFAGEAQEKTQ